jgi:hypothetical protein
MEEGDEHGDVLHAELNAVMPGVFKFVMAGPVPAIHAFFAAKAWMPGTDLGFIRDRMLSAQVG